MNEKSIEMLIPLAITIGFSSYIFLLNLSSYFIDIRVNFYLLLAVLAATAGVLSVVNKNKEAPKWEMTKKWRMILLGTTFLIIAVAGVIALRSESSDQMFYDHLPLAATISEGNFPVRAVFAPEFPSQYHYGYNLFLAAIARVTGLPVWLGHDLQNGILIGAIFLLGFLLIRNFCRSNFKAFLGALVMLFGGNLNFLYGIDGLSSLYRKFILAQPIDAPFRFVSDMIFGKEIHGSIITIYFEVPWVLLGFALSLTIMHLYFRAAHEQNHWLKISLLCAVLFAVLALVAELFFSVFAAVFIAFPAIYALLKKDLKLGRIYFKISLLILFLGILFAFLQGGIVSQTARQVFFGHASPISHNFSISPEYLFKGLALINVTNENVAVPIFGQDFIFGWGWLIFFIIPAAAYLIARHPQVGSFLVLLIIVSFAIPLIVNAGISQGDFVDINYLSALFWNLIFGFVLAVLILHFRSYWKKILLGLFVLVVIFQGMIYLLLFSVFPDLQFGRPFLGRQMPALNAVEKEAFNWIQKETEIPDIFFTFGEINAGTYHNSSFIIRTGRFAPDFLYWYNIQKNMESRYDAFAPQVSVYKNILENCETESLKSLGYHYLYVNKYWPRDLEQKCLANSRLELKFDNSEANEFARIYKIN